MNIISYAIGLNSGGSKEPVLESISITANGTYTPDAGIDGYNSVSVSVPQEGAPTAEELTFTGDCESLFEGGTWDWVVNKYGNLITTNNISNMSKMFKNSSLTTIPFEINGKSGSPIYMESMFQWLKNLTSLPTVKNVQPANMGSLFANCELIRTIPENYTDTWNWDTMDGYTSQYSGTQSMLFYNCHSLRSFPLDLIAHGNKYAYSSYSLFYAGFSGCRVLDEITIPVIYTEATWNSNAMSDTFLKCSRLKKLVFQLQQNGQPYVVKWKNQTIELLGEFGYTSSISSILNYNSGITADKEVSDAATYEALKNNPDWFTQMPVYSRYNHDSAVETINSLPDTSAYLAENGGTNTIQFNSVSGKLTDGGAINTLTEEEIAVAVARGWTVSFT